LNDGQSYDRCSACGIRRYVDIEPLGHDMVLVEGSGVAPTCLEAGYEGDFVCSRKDCGYLEKGAIIPAHGHKDENHDDICDICGNDNCQHIWGEWLDNGDGTHTRICSINENHIQKSEHNFDDGVITVFANCMNNGKIVYTCLDCGFERVDEYSEIRHSYPDNWTDNGNNHIKVCEYGCGEKLEERSSEPVLDHVGGEWEELLAPTCAENGIDVQKCTVCGEEVSRRDTDPTGEHVAGEWEVVIPSTCTKNGIKVQKLKGSLFSCPLSFANKQAGAVIFYGSSFFCCISPVYTVKK
jgi:hypothetical protein